MVRVQCPCCDYFTFDSIEDALFEICEVCFWQYDEVAHDRPKVNIGANLSIEQPQWIHFSQITTHSHS
ncbi:hypothetical protein FE783_10025 [Paenibacillus mesophilus]|uniref:CPCC family cysteine-rich protein n=1 Tax=Paenibacillus mesophilus TaxID=2582849 RepID=UPI00110D52A6|nr:hypothetical protein FE783_10025 [Paenibacillus mesophilus]